MSKVICLIDREPGEKPKVKVAGFVIEEDIPIPGKKQPKSDLTIALEALEVGQSIFVPDGTCTGRMAKDRCRTTALLKTRVFAVRGVEGGSRIWRRA